MLVSIGVNACDVEDVFDLGFRAESYVFFLGEKRFSFVEDVRSLFCWRAFFFISSIAKAYCW